MIGLEASLESGDGGEPTNVSRQVISRLLRQKTISSRRILNTSFWLNSLPTIYYLLEISANVLYTAVLRYTVGLRLLSFLDAVGRFIGLLRHYFRNKSWDEL